MARGKSATRVAEVTGKRARTDEQAALQVETGGSVETAIDGGGAAGLGVLTDDRGDFAGGEGAAPHAEVVDAPVESVGVGPAVVVADAGIDTVMGDVAGKRRGSRLRAIDVQPRCRAVIGHGDVGPRVQADRHAA